MKFYSRVVTDPSPSEEHYPWCAMTPLTNNSAKNQNIIPMEIYKLARCRIYNVKPIEKKNQHESMKKMTTILLTGAL